MPAGNQTRSAWLALTLLLAAGAAHADYRETYSRGLAALKAGDYAGARKLFEQALADQPEPALRTRLYGQRYEPYLPQHYLGMAAFQAGDCAAAMAQWSSGASERIVAQLPDVKSEQQRGRAACEQKGFAAKEEPARPPVEQNASAEKVGADRAIAEKATVEKKGTDKTGAETASVDKSAAKASADRTVADQAVADKSRPASSSVVDTTSPPPPLAGATAKAPGAGEKPVATKVERPPAPGVAAADSVRTPPASLVEAFGEFLAGRYKEVGRMDPQAYADTRARFHAYVVRAAARFTLAEINADKELLDSARADARAARALDGKATPDATLFSPRFRAFYREGT